MIGAGNAARADDLYDAWKQWCDGQGRDKPGTKQMFGRDLHAAFPVLKVTRPRDPLGRRYRQYEGIRLRTPDDDRPPTTATARQDPL